MSRYEFNMKKKLFKKYVVAEEGNFTKLSTSGTQMVAIKLIS